MNSPRIDDFPKYRDGEVSIVISSTRIYQLHSTILKRNSPYFERELDSAGARLTSKARQEGVAAYRFELVYQGPRNIGYFERKEVTDSGRVPRSSFVLSDLDKSGSSEQKTQYWDWLFGSFYGKRPRFCDDNLATILQDCMGLVDVAESIGSVDRVRELVDLALIRQDHILWQAIARNPTAWTELGRRVHSPTIFKEGVIHLVGTWPHVAENIKEDMDKAVRALVERKFKELGISKEAIEMRILGHYPDFLTRDAADKPGRPSYASDIYMWMAICFFRHWFAQAISEDKTRRAADGGYAFYNALAKGGQAYLSHRDFQSFHKYFPMSSKACNVLEANMGSLKEDVKKFVADICVSRVHVKPEDIDIDWLTCAVIKKEDLPWEVPEEDRMAELPDVFSGEDEPPVPAPSTRKLKKQKKRLGGTVNGGGDDVSMNGGGEDMSMNGDGEYPDDDY